MLNVRCQESLSSPDRTASFTDCTGFDVIVTVYALKRVNMKIYLKKTFFKLKLKHLYLKLISADIHYEINSYFYNMFADKVEDVIPMKEASLPILHTM